MMMTLAALKNCPRCTALFSCNPDNIRECQCTTVELNAADRRFISNTYDDCLCVSCLLAVHYEITQDEPVAHTDI